MTLRRLDLTCRVCGRHAHPLDERLGVEDFVSPHAQRLLCLLGAEHAFERSAQLLREVAGLCVCVNTTCGWREVRLSRFARRPRGEPVTDLGVWDEQRLPGPTARMATAAIRTSAALGPQWRRMAGRLGVRRCDELTVRAESRSIGSGMVEGACNTAIGRRLKQTGARWRVRRLERMASLCCLVYADQLDDYWRQVAGERPDSVTAPVGMGRPTRFVLILAYPAWR